MRWLSCDFFLRRLHMYIETYDLHTRGKSDIYTKVVALGKQPV